MNGRSWVWGLIGLCVGGLLVGMVLSRPSGVEPAARPLLVATVIATALPESVGEWVQQEDGTMRQYIATTSPEEVEAEPILTLQLALVDDATGEVVRGTVYMGYTDDMGEMPRLVPEARHVEEVCFGVEGCIVAVPATFYPLNVQVVAPGYAVKSINMRANVKRSQVLQLVLRLVPLEGVEG